jgi:hypothetical protein
MQRLANWEQEDGTLAFPLDYYPALTPLPWDAQRNLVAYCIEEARRQQDTVWHGWRLYDAWLWFKEYERAMRGDYDFDKGQFKPVLTHAVIQELGRRVDETNVKGYRKDNIHIGGKVLPPYNVAQDIGDWLVTQDTAEPGAFYLAFERIHPFGDGNGRTGKILFNWRNGTLDNPVWPPDFFGGIQNP